MWGENSLELLLDTMCDCFGGVMFIAMLVAIMSQFAEVKVPNQISEASATVKQLETDRASLQSELQRTKKAGTQQVIVSSVINEHPNRDLLPELAKLKDQCADSITQRDQAISGVSATEKRIKEIVSEADQLGAKAKELEAKLNQARKEGERTRVSRELRLPKLRPSTTIPFWMIVKGNRLYLLLRPGSEGFDEVNDAAVEHEESPGQNVFKAKPGCGIALNGDWTSAYEIRSLLNSLSTSSYNLQFAVYPDSYGAFIRLKEFFLKQGYEYNWAAMPNADLPLVLVRGTPPVQ